MKKAAILILVVMIAGLLFGQEVHYANQVTVEWDAVADTGSITYQLYRAAHPVTDPQNVGAHEFLGETAETNFVVSFSAEGTYAVGVRTKKEIDSEVIYSDINWSYENGAETPAPFVVGYYSPPAAPLGLQYR